ncbi:MAG: 50S ribosomal protein L24 [Patescibacteria group bacterium]|nr:50S ribosomal protein L24 [Patescibacteria group bacterium]MDD5164661.1 50S ribosomal protein L24 [Patescibacteria group bacterium]MDD5534813.1 50S ribosomal protein L24 [Patescibacteria group bacterium]
MKIRKGDTVKMMQGKDRGKKGRVVKVFPQENKIMVEEINMVIKHVRAKRENEKGQRIRKPMPFNASRVLLVCPKCAQTIRIASKVLADGRKIRFCKKCKEVI